MKSQIERVKKMNSQLAVFVVLGLFLLTFCFSWVSFSSYVAQLEAVTQGHSLADYLNASIQRLVKLELMSTASDELIFNLDNTIAELEPAAGETSKYFGEQTEILQEIFNVSDDWTLTKETIEQYREDGDSAALLAASERLFYHAASLSILATDYVSTLSAAILRLQLLLVAQIVAVALIIVHRLFLTLVELKKNQALSESLAIDTATGLYNRSKCHEILRTITGGQHPRVMIVFDLNDLKKTNDLYGHRVGDELIQTFARLIKEGAKVHNKDVFIGRYGGDEFMVYYNNINADELRLYLQEVAFLTQSFNNNETRFQVSYAAGYAISIREKPGITLRQLFDIADKDMYRNKAEMKRKQAQMNTPSTGQTVVER
ncbi:MAG: GGDEF domain-containing protein [Faecalibacterium sp.]